MQRPWGRTCPANMRNSRQAAMAASPRGACSVLMPSWAILLASCLQSSLQPKEMKCKTCLSSESTGGQRPGVPCVHSLIESVLDKCQVKKKTSGLSPMPHSPSCFSGALFSAALSEGGFLTIWVEMFSPWEHQSSGRFQ